MATEEPITQTITTGTEYGLYVLAFDHPEHFRDAEMFTGVMLADRSSLAERVKALVAKSLVPRSELEAAQQELLGSTTQIATEYRAEVKRLEAEVERLRTLARRALSLADSASHTRNPRANSYRRDVASLRALIDPPADEGGYGVHTCHADCPCHRGEQPLPDFIEAGNTGSAESSSADE